MEEDNEVLDWGNEEEEHHQHLLSNAPPMEDADDAVSLGDEEDEQAFYSQQYPGNTNDVLHCLKSFDDDSGDHSGLAVSQEMSVGRSSQHQQEYRQDDKNDSQSGSTSRSHTSNQKDSPKRSQPLLQPRLTHALPPKPIASTLPYIPPSHPSIVEATAMSARARDHKRSTGSGEKTVHYKEPLPPDWEIRYPRSGGRTFYYYNVVTHQSTWYHPGFPPPNRPNTGPNSSKTPAANNYGPSGLTYDDRHYRPGSPEIRHEDRMHTVSDLRPTERGYTPPRSPHLRGRARSASPVPVPVIQRQSSVELRGRTRSSHLSHNAEAKGEFSDQARDRDIPLVDSSESRWVTSSIGRNDSNGHTNREARHPQRSPVGIIEHAGSAIEDRPMVSRSHRSHSARGRNRERESIHSSVESRQESNHSQKLSTSRHHSPPSPHDREWIPAQRDRRGTDFAQQPSTVPAKVESNSRAASGFVAPRRDRLSRFDQPSTAPLANNSGSSITTEQSHARPRERDIYVSDDSGAPYERSTERDRGHHFSTQRMLVNDGKVAYIDDRPAHQSDWQQAVPANSENVAPASDQPGPSSRRKRAPLPPQSTSFLKEFIRKKDYELPRQLAGRPPLAQTSVTFPTGPREHANDGGTPRHGPRHSSPRVRANSDMERPRPPLVNGPQYEEGTGRERTISTEYSASGSGYSQTQAHTPVDVPMDLDVDSLPSSSSRLPPTPLPDVSNDSINKSLSARSSVPRVPPPADVYSSRPGDDKKRGDVRASPMEPHSKQDFFIPRNKRAIYDGTDRHVSREVRSHPSDFHRLGPAGYVPKLTGPNSVPIGTRRHDTGSRLPEAIPPPLQSPVRNLKSLPPLPPGKESYERPVYDVKAALDSYRTIQQEVAGPAQGRQRNSSPVHKRDHPFKPPSPVIISPKGGRRDFHPRDRSRFDQPSREGRVPQSYERPVPDPPTRPLPPPHEPNPSREELDGPYADQQPLKPAVEPREPLKSSHAKLLAAKEKLERFAEEDRLRKQEQEKTQADGNSQSKTSPVGLLSAEEERQRAVEQEISHLRLQEAKNNQGEPERHRSSNPFPPPHFQEQGALLDIVRSERFADGQKQPLPVAVLPIERDYPSRSQRPPERIHPTNPALVNTPPSPFGERRTRWDEPLQIVGASDALKRLRTERADGRGQRPGQIDRYESNYGGAFPGAAHHQRRPPPPPRAAKDSGQLGEASRSSETLQGASQIRGYEKARPSSRPLLDRLSLGTPTQMSPNEPPSLRDRVQIPEKRDRNEMDYPVDAYETEAAGGGASEPAMKRARRRNNKPKRVRRGGAAS
ncbi:hypothetical protein AX15_002074 [Amanita polypyramis BW_CC]|nr:hypothetical protein AX15_002074 [Amanita polypyramis BW_CC]